MMQERKFIINTKECPERIIAQYNIDVEKSCNINRCMRQNKQPKNSEINHCKKRKQEGAANMRQYRSAKASPIEPSIMNTREIIENLVLLHRKEQNAMNSRETIENLMLLDRKKQHSMNSRGIIVTINFMIWFIVRVLCMYVPVVTSRGVNIVSFMLVNLDIPVLRLTNILVTRKVLITCNIGL